MTTNIFISCGTVMINGIFSTSNEVCSSPGAIKVDKTGQNIHYECSFLLCTCRITTCFRALRPNGFPNFN